MAEKMSLVINDFGDGLNTKLPPARLKPSEAVLAYNLRSEGGVLKSRRKKIFEGMLGTTFLDGLALSKPVTAGPVSPGGLYPEKITDGIIGLNNGWTSNNSCPSSANPVWVYIDLGIPVAVTRVVLFPFALTPELIIGFPIQFKIQVSADTVNWFDIVVQNNYPFPTTQVGEVFDSTDLTENCRYLRIYITGTRTQDGNPALCEVQVSGYQPSTSPIHSLAIFEKEDSTRYFLAGIENKIYSKAIVSTPWWTMGEAWLKRLPLTITNSDFQTYSGARIKVVLSTTIPGFNYVDTNGGNSLRFIDSNGITEIPYWIDVWNEAGASTVWLALPSISANSTKTIQMYFSNASAPPKSAPFYGDNTLLQVMDDEFDTDPFAIPARMQEFTFNVQGDFVEYDATAKAIKVTGGTDLWYAGARPVKLKFSDMSFIIETDFTWMEGGDLLFQRICLYGCGYDTEYRPYKGYGIEIRKNYMAICEINEWTTWVEKTITYISPLVVGKKYNIKMFFDNTNKKVSAILTEIDSNNINKGEYIFAVQYMLDSVGFYGVGDWGVVNYLFHNFKFYEEVLLPSTPGNVRAQGTGGTWTEQTTALLTSSEHWSCAILNNKIIIANGVDTPRVWDGLSNWVIWDGTHGLNEPVKYLAVHKGRLWAGCVPANPSRIFYCNVNERGEAKFDSPYSWKTWVSCPGGAGHAPPHTAENEDPGDTWTDTNYEDITPGDGGIITGLVAPMFDSLVVLKDNRIVVFHGNSPSDWGEKVLAHPFGCIDPRSLTKYEDVLFFRNRTGVHFLSGEMGNVSAFSFDNIKADSLSEQIEPTMLEQQIGTAIGATYDNKYYLFFPEESNNKCLILDWRRKSWWIDNEGMTSALVDTETGIFYVGGANGKIYRYEGSPTTTVNGTWKSGVLPLIGGYETRIRNIFIEFEGSLKLSVWTEKKALTLVTLTADSRIKRQKIGCNLSGKQVEIMMEDITTQVNKIELELIPLRKR